MTLNFLAIDDESLPLRMNVSLHIAKPKVRAEPVLRPAEPGSGAVDDGAAHFYGTVLHDGVKFRMWYYACHAGKNPDWSPKMMQQIAKLPSWFKGDYILYQGPLCYAESDDGITWTKPALNQVLFKGSRANNALALPHTVVSGAIVIKDDADPNPARRYKMTYQFFPDQSDPVIDEYGRMPSVATAVSPDGVRWTVTGIPFLNQFVEPSSFIKHAGQYVIHYQIADNWTGYRAEGGTKCGRTGVARISHDFDHWPDMMVEAFALAEPEDVSKRGASGGYDQVHLGVGAASLGNVCVGLYGLWHNADNEASFSDISCDFGLLISNDGVRFREPVKGHRFMRRADSLVTPVPGYNFNTILCQANGILNVGDETRIYHGRWRNAGIHNGVNLLKYYSAEVALATIPRDRWGDLVLNPDAASGVICSKAITLPPRVSRLSINGTGVAGMTVDLLDEDFKPIAGFTGGTAGTSDGLDCAVQWNGKAIAELAGKAVRVRVSLRRLQKDSPRLGAFYLHSS